jgi:hypothetical protein
VQLLVAPNKQQMHTLAVQYSLAKNTQLTTEVALTNFDVNKLSKANNNENVGYAARLILKNTGKIIIKNNEISTKTQLNYEFLNQNFRVFQPYREAEFARNWNVKQIYSQKAEHLGAVSFGLYDKTNNGANLQLSKFIIGEKYNAFKHKTTANYNKNGWATGLVNDATQFEFDDFVSKFVKQTVFIHKNTRYAAVGTSFLQERNQVFLKNTDSLTQNSFYFRQAEAFVASPDTAQNKITLKYNVRQDFFVKNAQFAPLQLAHNLIANANLTRNPDHQAELTTTYRFVADTNTNQLTQSYLGQIEYRGKWLKKLVSASVFYSFGNGQEPVRDFTFLRVASGVGNFTWRDFNGNSKPEINEYVQAFFGDSANYVKVFLPNNRYVQTFGSRYNHSININPQYILTQKTAVNSVVRRFSVLSTFAIERKTQNNAPLVYLNPFSLFRDTALVRSNAQVRNTLFFNRNDPVFGAEFQLQNTLNKLLTTNGFTERTNQGSTLKIRYNINQKISIETTATNYIKAQKSQFFGQNDFDIQGMKVEPALIYMYKNKFRLATTYNFTNEKNILNAANDRAKTHKITFDTNLSLRSTTLLRAAISWVQIDYTGTQNTAVAYELLQGLQAGSNQVLNLNIQHTLPNSIQIGAGYDARKSAITPIIQSIKVQARYVF